MFGYLPFHIKETIFSYVRYMDFFETARVSHEWWFLTIASFERFLHEKDNFLLDQVDFCNQVMTKEEPWEWWMFLEFTKSKKIQLKSSHLIPLVTGPEARLIKYYKSNEVSVRHLFLDMSVDRGCGECPTNLNQLFPTLISLKLNQTKVEDATNLVFPNGLQCLCMCPLIFYSTTNLSVILQTIMPIKVLRIDFFSNIVFDRFNFDNLTRLTLTLSWTEPKPELLRQLFNESKNLSSVSLKYMTITKEWLAIVPKYVKKVTIHNLILDLDVQEEIGQNVLYERQLLFYICKDWKSVEYFKATYVRLKKLMNAPLNHYPHFIDYVCKPRLNEEEIWIESEDTVSDINTFISLRNEDLALTKLTTNLVKRLNYLASVPRTVRNMSLWTDRSVNLALADLFQNCTLIEKLELKLSQTLSQGFIDLPMMTNLNELTIDACDTGTLEYILNSCSSLRTLSLQVCEPSIFGCLAPEIKSKSLAKLTIRSGFDTIDNILKHLPYLQYLDLWEFSSETLLKTDVETIKGLSFLKVKVDKCTAVHLHLSSLQFPRMLLLQSEKCITFAACKGSELMNLIADDVFSHNRIDTKSFTELNFNFREASHIYVKNIPTRCLKLSFPWLCSIEEIIDKTKSSKVDSGKL